MKHVFVETNWLVDYAAPGHHKTEKARTLLERADAGELKLLLPAVCLTEARRVILYKFTPAQDARTFRRLFRWIRETQGIPAEQDTMIHALNRFQREAEQEQKNIGATLSSLAEPSEHPGLEVFHLSQPMLERAAWLALQDLYLEPFDQAILAAVLVRAEGLRDAGEADVCFCETDQDLCPWGKKVDRVVLLKRLYDSAHVWVFDDFALNGPQPPLDWLASS